MAICQVYIDGSKYAPVSGRLQNIDGGFQYTNSRIPFAQFLPINALVIECFSQKSTATVKGSMIHTITDYLFVRTKGVFHPVQIIIALGLVR